MARKIKVLPLAVLVVSLIAGASPSKAEIDEPDRILETVGPQVIKLRQCYEGTPSYDSCSELKRAVKRSLDSCSFEENDVRASIRSAAPKVGLEKIELILAAVRDRSRARVETAIMQYRIDFPTACPIQGSDR
jgi:hypothetical protein